MKPGHAREQCADETAIKTAFTETFDSKRRPKYKRKLRNRTTSVRWANYAMDTNDNSSILVLHPGNAKMAELYPLTSAFRDPCRRI